MYIYSHDVIERKEILFCTKVTYRIYSDSCVCCTKSCNYKVLIISRVNNFECFITLTQLILCFILIL